MELTYTTEKSEKETIKLFLRRHEFLLELHSVMVIGALFGGLLAVSSGSFGVVPLVFCLGYIVLDWFLIYVPRRFYRRRVTNRVEYHLTDDAVAFTVGDTHFSSTWKRAAKKFRIDKKAIYLYGKNLPFETQCIPDWQGHGVEKKELIAMLKNAGLKKTMSGRLKFLIGIVATPVVLATLLTIYFYIGGIEWGDWTIPNEASLRLELHDVPDEENAYLALQNLTNTCTIVADDENFGEMSDKDFVSNYGQASAAGDGEARAKWAAVRNNPSSPKRATRILAENAEFFKSFRSALSRSGFCDKERAVWYKEIKERSEMEWSPLNGYLPDLRCFIRFAQLFAMKAQVALENGDAATAAGAIDDVHALGQKISTNSCCFVDYLVGALIEKYSYSKICDAVVTGVSGEILEKFGRILDEDDANASSCFAQAVRMEMAYVNILSIEWLRNATGDSVIRLYDQMDELGEGHRIAGLERLLWRWPGYFQFSIHRRKAMYRMAEVARAALSGNEWPEWDTSSSEERSDSFFRRLLPNWCMSRWTERLPLVKGYLEEGNMNRLSPRLVLATEKWRRVHGGKNPSSLDALVPDYLAAVPKDPWCKSGEPIKYDAALGVAWSVGKDGTYDYRKIAKERAAGNKASVDVDTQKYAFRVDGKSINNETDNASGGTKHLASSQILKNDSTSATQSQYAAEVLPVIGNLRTKIGLFQYDKGILPCIATNEVVNGKDTGKVSAPQIETWVPVDSEAATAVSATPSKARVYKMASCTFPGGDPPMKGLTVLATAKSQDSKNRHLGVLVDIDPLDLLGKYSRPCHFQHLVMRNGRDCAYVLGCFGDGNGLPAGTGYAVCEISSSSTGRKYIGTWERYQSTGNTQICFTSSTSSKDDHALGCYVPEKSVFDNMTEKDTLSRIVDTMKNYGWDFGNQ